MLACSFALLFVAACQPARTVPPAASPTPSPGGSPTPGATATATGAPITAANASTLKLAGTFAGSEVQRLVWATDGRLFVVGVRAVDAVDPSTGNGKRLLAVTAPDRLLAVSPAGIAVVAGAQGAPVRLVSVANGQTLANLAPGGLVNSATFYRGTRLALVAGDRIAVTLWDTGSGQKLGELTGFQTAAPVYDAVLSEDGARAAWVSRATLQFSDPNTGAFLPRAAGFEDFIGAYTYLPDGRFVTTTADSAGGALVGRVQIWDPATGAEVLRFSTPSLLLTLAASNGAPSAVLLATGGDGIRFWSATDGKQVAAIDAATAGRVSRASFAPDRTALATVSDGGSVRFWRPS